jgi:hypothetical protein
VHRRLELDHGDRSRAVRADAQLTALTHPTNQGYNAMTRLLKLPALAAVLTALLIYSTALAATSASRPVLVANFSQQNGYTQLRVQLNNGKFYFANPGQGQQCQIPEPTLDTAKVWYSLANSSVMSGRKVTIGYTECGGYDWITSIDLGP